MRQEITITDDITIEQAKIILRKEIDKGFTCPCCNRYTRMYSRKMTSSMAYALILLFKAPEHIKNETGYIHVENYFKTLQIPSSIRGDFPKTRFWGLIQPECDEVENGEMPSNGMYKITQDGIDFVQNMIYVPSHVKIYNNWFFGYDQDKAKGIYIKDALKDKFNYSELMGGE